MSALVVNLFGGPGAGKSTIAAALFSALKMSGRRTELVTEYAKELTYARAWKDLTYQLHILGEQERRLRRVADDVDVVVTDSPLLLSSAYARGPYASPWFHDAVFHAFTGYDNFNVRVRRVKPYAAYGRSQSEAEAEEIDRTIGHWLDILGLPYVSVDGDQFAVSCVRGHVIRLLQARQSAAH